MNIFPAAYWQWIVSWAGYDRERAFQQWRDSGYADVNAHKQFIAAYERANYAGLRLIDSRK